jgi:hypothetical protein
MTAANDGMEGARREWPSSRHGGRQRRINKQMPPAQEWTRRWLE